MKYKNLSAVTKSIIIPCINETISFCTSVCLDIISAPTRIYDKKNAAIGTNIGLLDESIDIITPSHA